MKGWHNMAEGDVFDKDRAQGAMKAVIELFADRELTAAEAIHVIRCLAATFKANYPDAFKIMWPKYGGE